VTVSREETGERELAAYYARRAPEYERIYERPERRADLVALGARVRSLVAGADVLEVACGTGYWTERFAAAARSVLATDVGGEVLEIARRKTYPPGRVSFAVADAFRLQDLPRGDLNRREDLPHGDLNREDLKREDLKREGLYREDLPREDLPDRSLPLLDPPGRFTAAVAGFWFSHLPRGRRGEFLGGLGGCLAPGARVVLFDNRYVHGESLPISRRDAAGDTFQHRHLADGSEHEVRKNFPARGELEAAAARFGTAIAVDEWRHFWCLSYRTLR
jgi:SAM-dependent methyltransferase